MPPETTNPFSRCSVSVVSSAPCCLVLQRESSSYAAGGIKLLASAFPKREYQNCLSYIGQRFHKSLINLDKFWRGISRKLLFLFMFCRLAKARSSAHILLYQIHLEGKNVRYR